eukprot:g6736.t1
MEAPPVRSGAIHHIGEILDDTDLHHASVRVMGRLQRFDAATQRAVIAHGGRTLPVDTSLLGPVAFAVGSTFQFIGEMEVIAADAAAGAACGSTAPLLRARVAQDVDGVDEQLFARALEVRRRFLADPRFVPQPAPTPIGASNVDA